jgi:hypothetical protein
MSSIMRARSALTGWSEGWKIIGGPFELKVAGPSMLGIGCPDRHAFLFTRSRVHRRRRKRTDRAAYPSRASGFGLGWEVTVRSNAMKWPRGAQRSPSRNSSRSRDEAGDAAERLH